MTDAKPLFDSAQSNVSCVDLCAAIALYTEQRGFRLDMIMPADAPRVALVSRDGITLRLEASADRDAQTAVAENPGEFVLRRAGDHDAWPEGRAGMQYRDLIPGRLGGRMIASHIRIPDGGPVPDYVHYHKVGFQMIHCRRGWVRVVYEDQGPPFVMHAGDCVLQPPTIRHRVLESSPGLEVVEIGCPAEHETWRDHELALPTPHRHPHRSFAGQRFLHHIAAEAVWQPAEDAGFEFRDTGIAEATDGIASVRVLRAMANTNATPVKASRRNHGGDAVFLFVLEGQLQLRVDARGAHAMRADDACAILAGADYAVEALAPCQVLEVAIDFSSSERDQRAAGERSTWMP
jgi:quercetin dioxygenase-like cupin family protein